MIFKFRFFGHFGIIIFFPHKWKKQDTIIIFFSSVFYFYMLSCHHKGQKISCIRQSITLIVVWIDATKRYQVLWVGESRSRWSERLSESEIVHSISRAPDRGWGETNQSHEKWQKSKLHYASVDKTKTSIEPIERIVQLCASVTSTTGILRHLNSDHRSSNDNNCYH